MKYLKTYESLVDSPDYYHRISMLDFNTKFEKFEYFNKDEIDAIQKICNQKKIHMELLNNGKFTQRILLEFPDLLIRSIIYKSDDEWFPLSYNIGGHSVGVEPEYYRADQLEGLIKLIQDLV